MKPKKDNLDGLLGGFRGHFRSTTTLDCLSWNEKYRRLPDGRRFHPWPWQAEMLQAPAESSVSEIIVMAASQVCGKSEVLLAILAHRLCTHPGDYLCVLPSLPQAERWSRTRFSNTVQATPELAALLPGQGLHTKAAAGSSLLFKKLTNGSSLAICGANSASSLAAASISGLFFDEIDLAPAKLLQEGSPVALAARRLAAFSDSFLVESSTPSITGESRIEEDYLRSDRRRWCIPCPTCGHQFALRFENIVWDSPLGVHQPESARIKCPSCAAEHDDSVRRLMVMNGAWVPENPTETRVRGYWLSGFNVLLPTRKGYASRLHEQVAEFLAVKSNPVSLQPWINGVAGESFAPEVLRPVSLEYLVGRKTNLFGRDDQPDPSTHPLPEKVLILTLGCDVQSNRLETLLTGWGRGRVCWLLDHKIWPGVPSLPSVWDALSEYIASSWSAPGWAEEGKRLSAAVTFIDSGFLAPVIHQFCAKRSLCFPTKGVGSSLLPLVELNKAKRGVGGGLRLIKTDGLKQLAYQRLQIDDRNSDGYVHLDVHLSSDFLAQVTTETATKDARTGQMRFRLTKNASNEGLDLLVLNTAAEYHLRPNYDGLEAQRRGVDKLPEEETTPNSLSPRPPRKFRPVRASIWGPKGLRDGLF